MKVIDLLKLMLERKAPKKIEVLGFRLNFVPNAHWGDYEDEIGNRLSDFRLNECLNDEVEIIEPQEHKIPEKLEYKYRNLYGRISQCKQSEIPIIDKINEILDYLEVNNDRKGS